MIKSEVNQKTGSSRFSEGLRFNRMDGDELNQREKVIFIPVSIGNSLSNFNPVIETFQFTSGDGMRGMCDEPINPFLLPLGKPCKSRNSACFGPLKPFKPSFPGFLLIPEIE